MVRWYSVNARSNTTCLGPRLLLVVSSSIHDLPPAFASSFTSLHATQEAFKNRGQDRLRAAVSEAMSSQVQLMLVCGRCPMNCCQSLVSFGISPSARSVLAHVNEDPSKELFSKPPTSIINQNMNILVVLRNAAYPTKHCFMHQQGISKSNVKLTP